MPALPHSLATHVEGWLLLLALVLLAPVSATPIGAPPQRLYTPPDTEYAIATDILWDARGIMMVTNQEKLWEFDGVAWRAIESIEGKIPMRLAHRQEEKRTYVLGYQDIGYLDTDAQGSHRYVDLKPELNEAMQQDVLFLDLLWDGQGNRYVRNLRNIYRFAGRQAAQHWSYTNIVSHIFEHRGFIYACTTDLGIFRIEGNQQIPIPLENRGNTCITASTSLPDGRAVVAMDNGPVYFLDGKRLTPLLLEPAAIQPAEFFLKLSTLPNTWIAGVTSTSTLVVFDTKGNLLWRLGSDQGLRLAWGSRPTVDPSGYLWVGTRSGLAQIDLLSPMSVLDYRHGLSEFTRNTCITRNQIYCGNGQALWRSRDQSYATAKLFEPIPGIDGSESNLVTWQGKILFSGSRIDGVRSTTPILYLLDPVHGGRTALGEGGRYQNLSRVDPNILYMITDRECFRYVLKLGNWVRDGQPFTLPRLCMEFAEDEEGALWFLTGNDSVGRLRYDPEGKSEWRLFTAADGLPKDWITPRRVGTEVVFCTKVGMYQFNAQSQRFSPHPQFQDLPQEISAEFLQIEADELGNLWIASREGTGVMRRQTNGNYQWDLLGLRFLGKAQVHNLLFEENLLWIVTPDRLVRYDDRIRMRPQLPFKTLIRSIEELGGKRVLFGGATPEWPRSLTLPYEQNDLRIGYAATSMDDPQRNEFSLRVEGLVEAWTDWSPKGTHDLINLREGTYTLSIRSRNFLGTMGEEAQLALTILPPWYRTWWSYGLYGLGAVLAVAGSSHLRSRLLRRKNALLQKLVDDGTERIRHQADELSVANEQMAQANEELKETNDELATTIQQLTGANQRLEELDREKNEFIGIVSHDLRNPLGAISQASELLESAPELSEESREIIELVQTSANTSLGIVTNLLDLNRIEQGRLVTALVPCDLSDAALRAADSYRERAKAKHIELLVVAPDPMPVTADTHLLDQVLGNLISNAVKYSPQGRRVWITVRTLGDKPRCEVRDEGHGIRPEEMSKLFKKFSRLSNKPTAGEQSVGLGLAIVQRMVEAMKGRIWCESVYGQGATFIIELEKA